MARKATGISSQPRGAGTGVNVKIYYISNSSFVSEIDRARGIGKLDALLPQPLEDPLVQFGHDGVLVADLSDRAQKAEDQR